MDASHPNIVARFDDGTIRDYGAPDNGAGYKLWAMVEALTGGHAVPCGIEAARAQTLGVNGAQESAAIAEFDRRDIGTACDANGRLTYVQGLGEALLDCAAQFRLPSEMGLPWARPGRAVDLRGYARFPGG